MAEAGPKMDANIEGKNAIQNNGANIEPMDTAEASSSTDGTKKNGGDTTIAKTGEKDATVEETKTEEAGTAMDTAEVNANKGSDTAIIANTGGQGAVAAATATNSRAAVPIRDRDMAATADHIMNAINIMNATIDADSATTVNSSAITAIFRNINETGQMETFPVCSCKREKRVPAENVEEKAGDAENVPTTAGVMGPPTKKMHLGAQKKGKGVEKKKKGKGKEKGRRQEEETETIVKVAETGAALPISEDEMMKVVMKLQRKYRKAQKDMCSNCKNQSVTKIHTTLKLGDSSKEYNMQMYLFDMVNLADEGMPNLPSKYLN